MTAIAMSFVEAQVKRVVIAAVGVASTGATQNKDSEILIWMLNRFHFSDIQLRNFIF